MPRTPADRTLSLLQRRTELRAVRDAACAAADATYRAALAELAEEALDLAADAHQLDFRAPLPERVKAPKRTPKAKAAEPAPVAPIDPCLVADILSLPVPRLKERIAGWPADHIRTLRVAEDERPDGARPGYVVTLDAAIRAAA